MVLVFVIFSFNDDLYFRMEQTEHVMGISYILLKCKNDTSIINQCLDILKALFRDRYFMIHVIDEKYTNIKRKLKKIYIINGLIVSKNES